MLSAAYQYYKSAIVFIELMLTVSLGPKVVTLSGFHCNYDMVLFYLILMRSSLNIKCYLSNIFFLNIFFGMPYFRFCLCNS
jgi:hypothetical protein